MNAHDNLPPDRLAFWTSVFTQAYSKAKEEINAFKDRQFPLYSFVYVDVTLEGFVVGEQQCPPEKLAVKLCNENVWYYELNRVTPMDRKTAGSELRMVYMKHRKIQKFD